MLSYRTIEPHTLELLKRLMATDCLSRTRLVGGTGLALQYGHRMSIDIDLFGKVEEENVHTDNMGRNEDQHTKTSGNLFPII